MGCGGRICEPAIPPRRDYESDELPGCSTPRSALSLRASQALDKSGIGRPNGFIATLGPLSRAFFGQIPIGRHSRETFHVGHNKSNPAKMNDCFRRGMDLERHSR